MKKFIWMCIVMYICCAAFVGCKNQKDMSAKQDVKENQEVTEPMENQFDATVTEVYSDYVMVEALEGQTVSGTVHVWLALEDEDTAKSLCVGDVIRITHRGQMTMSIPPQMTAIAIAWM